MNWYAPTPGTIWVIENWAEDNDLKIESRSKYNDDGKIDGEEWALVYLGDYSVGETDIIYTPIFSDKNELYWFIYDWLQLFPDVLSDYLDAYKDEVKNKSSM